MRKHQQKQILELLKVIGEAQDAGHWPECQQGAITAGEFIESLEGGDTQTVALLEEYCDLVYEAHAGGQRGRALRKALVSIENSVRRELKPDRIEVAFLSYKAAMSDCLESIYLAAKADPNCDAYWIPIPYIERNTDQVTGTECYEGAEYYGNHIECTWWEDYDIEQRHPDVVFTFYPYDDDNYLTGVRPCYQCEHLRKFTDMLVYIPYYVVADTAGMIEAHCTTSGCVFAHKVIVQSEEVRRFYIKSFRKLYSDGLGKPDNRFVALGSPKFDKVINSRREDYELPDDWARLIGGKKVVLYNTSVSAQLNHDDAYLEKLRTVLAAFKARDDIVVWWRPHPLMERTYATMRPWLIDLYKAIVAQYRAEGWGIFDDTPDVHRAIAWSDAYYGDEGSIFALWKVTGKPCVLQDVETPYAFSELGLAALTTLTVRNNKLYYHMFSRNAIIELDLDSSKPQYFGKAPNKTVFGAIKPHNYAEVYDDKIVFVPWNTDCITIYDYNEERFDSFKIDINDSFRTELSQYKWQNGLFRNFIIRGDLIFLLPGTYSAIISFNFKTGETMNCLDLREVFPEFFREKDSRNQLLFYTYVFLDADAVLLPSLHSNVVLELNLDDFSYKTHSIGDSDAHMASIAKHDDCFWLAAANKASVCKWNYDTGEVTTFTKFPKGFPGALKGSKNLFFQFSIVRYLSYLYLFPSGANAVCRVNMDSGEIEQLGEFDKYCVRNEDEDRDAFLYTVIYNGKLYAYNQIYRSILEYDIESKVIREFDNLLELSEEDCRILSDDYLDSFASGAEEYYSDESNEIQNCGTAGRAIYDYIKTTVSA